MSGMPAKYETFSGTTDATLTLTVVQGIAFWENAGTPGTAAVDFRDGAAGNIVWHDELAASEERPPIYFGPDGIKLTNTLVVDMVSGNVQGIAWGY